MTRTVATAIVAAVAVAGVLAQPSTPPLTHEYAEVNGMRLHYAKAGSGPLMVFLHGFPEFWYEWKNQLAEFSRDHTVVAPDLRGYNLSSKPADVSAYQIPNLVEDVRALTAELMKASGGSKFTLVAHDWGGVVAWVFAALHPDMLDRLVILNAPHPTLFGRELLTNPEQQKASGYMLMFRSAEAEALLSEDSYAWLKRAVLGDKASADDTAAYVAAWSQPGALTGGLNYYRASASDHLRRQLRREPHRRRPRPRHRRSSYACQRWSSGARRTRPCSSVISTDSIRSCRTSPSSESPTAHTGSHGRMRRT